MAAASDSEKEIHQLILQKDDLAFAKLCDVYFEPVLKRIITFNATIARQDETLLMDLVTDTFMNYFKNPVRYDPSKSGLLTFLVMDIEGDLKNALQKTKRQQQKNQKPVELDEETGNSILGDMAPNPAEQLIQLESASILENKLLELFSDARDIHIAHLLLAGERKSSEYARVLQIEEMEKHERELEIKRQKDRIGKTIKRKFRI